jgi:predicted phage terminase large subunit-like protein
MTRGAPVVDRPEMKFAAWDVFQDRLGVVDDSVLEERHKYRRFSVFVRRSWEVLEPYVEFTDGWFVDAICEHAEYVTSGEIKNLLVCMPPRLSKSTIMSQMWPAWEWTEKASLRYLTSSYAHDIALKDAVRMRRLVLSPWYQSLWGDKVRLMGDQNVKSRFDNDRGGGRIVTSVDGMVTGDGGDRVMVDDPHNVKEAETAERRDEVIHWWNGVMSTRRNDPGKSAMVVVQQRVHEEDLAGHLKARGDYVVLELPQEYQGKKVVGRGWVDPRKEIGELLVPDRWTDEAVEQQKMEMGPWDFAAQHNQDPGTPEGAILKRGNWMFYDPRDEESLPRFHRVGAFMDSAETIGQSSAYTAFALWGESRESWWLLDLIHGQYEFPELEDMTVDSWNEWRELPRGQRPREIVIEMKSSGIALVQALTKRTRLPIIGYTAPNDKEMRVHDISGYHAAKKFYLPLPETVEWDVLGFIKEHSDVPNGRLWDRVDTTTLMMHYWVIMPPKEKEKKKERQQSSVAGLSTRSSAGWRVPGPHTKSGGKPYRRRPGSGIWTRTG